jgi:hypothetical protein
MSAVFALQSLAAAQLSQFWGLTQTWQTIAFYLGVPIGLTIINMLGVFVGFLMFMAASCC